MLSRNVVFWEVDAQADFMLPGGKLYVPGAEKLLPNIRRLTDSARQGRVFLVSHGCYHTKDDPEFAIFPPHCVQGTPGANQGHINLIAANGTLGPGDVRSPANQIRVRAGSMGVAPGEQDDPFEEARLAGGVRAPEQLWAGPEPGVELRVASKGGEANGRKRGGP